MKQYNGNASSSYFNVLCLHRSGAESACCCQIALQQRTAGHGRNNAEHCSLQPDTPESGCVRVRQPHKGSVNAASTGDQPWWWCMVATFGNTTLIGIPDMQLTLHSRSRNIFLLSVLLSFCDHPAHHWIAKIRTATRGSLDF